MNHFGIYFTTEIAEYAEKKITKISVISVCSVVDPIAFAKGTLNP